MSAKNNRWRKKNLDLSLCPHCGKAPAPGYKQCLYRIKFKRLNRILNDECKRTGARFRKAGKGLFELTPNV